MITQFFMVEYSHIVQKIKTLIKEGGYSNYDNFAPEVPTTRQTLRNYLKEKTKMPMDVFFKISEALGLHPCEIIGHSGSKDRIHVSGITSKGNSSQTHVYSGNLKQTLADGNTSFNDLQEENNELKERLAFCEKEQMLKIQLIDMLNAEILQLKMKS